MKGKGFTQLTQRSLSIVGMVYDRAPDVRLHCKGRAVIEGAYSGQICISLRYYCIHTRVFS